MTGPSTERHGGSSATDLHTQGVLVPGDSTVQAGKRRRYGLDHDTLSALDQA